MASPSMQFTKKFLLLAALCCGFLLPTHQTHAALADSEQVSLVSLTPAADTTYQWQMQLLIGNRTETLLLNQSTTTANITITDQFGSPLSLPADTNYYSGIIANLPGSWVRISQAGDTLSGTVFASGEHFQIASTATGASAKLERLNTRDLNRLVASAGSDTLLFPPPSSRNGRIRNTLDAISITPDNGSFYNQPGNATKVIHVGIVVDTRYNEARGGRGLNLAIDTINSVDGLYREQLGIALSLDTTIVMTDPETDPLRIDDSTTEEILLEFRNYRRSTDLLGTGLNLVHYFTGNRASGTDVGLAFIGTVCRSDGYDVSASFPFQFPTILAAHEIAHNLGALHDEVTSCSNNVTRIMYSDISSLTTDSFSNCSLDKIAEKVVVSPCFSEAIDMELSLVQPTENTVIASALNRDLNRVIAGAELRIELSNASITALPASCILDSTTRAHCPTEAIGPEAQNDIEFTFQLTGTEQSTVQVELEPFGALDLIPANNTGSLVLAEDRTPAPDPDPIVVANAGDPQQDPQQNPASASGSGGGTLTPLQTLLLILLAGSRRQRRR